LGVYFHALQICVQSDILCFTQNLQAGFVALEILWALHLTNDFFYFFLIGRIWASFHDGCPLTPGFSWLIACKCTEEEDIDKCVCIPKAVRIGNRLAFLASTPETVPVQYPVDDKEQ
jgi:hypothetical protein